MSSQCLPSSDHFHCLRTSSRLMTKQTSNKFLAKRVWKLFQRISFSNFYLRVTCLITCALEDKFFRKNSFATMAIIAIKKFMLTLLESESEMFKAVVAVNLSPFTPEELKVTFWWLFVLHLGRFAHAKMFMQKSLTKAQWICLYLASRHPRFESQAHHLPFYHLQ